MIGTIRKHSKVLWWTIIPLTIISFVIFMSSGPARRGGGRAGGNFGSINGKPVTQSQYLQALNDFKLFYLFHYGAWPEKSAKFTEADIERETYLRLFLTQKAADLGIYAGLDAVAASANHLLQALARKGQKTSVTEFATQVLQPEGLTAADFENFVQNDLIIQQLVQTIGSSGVFITPQEAASLYEREHQEISSQIIFFSAEKFLPKVKVVPESLGQFYTNYQAEYRLPVRVQLDYVVFNITNYLAQAKAEWAKTNFEAQVQAIYEQYGEQAFPEAKTPEAAKEKVRDSLIRGRALDAATRDANDFTKAVFGLATTSAGNLAAVARQKGFEVKTTAPFAPETGPQEFNAPEGFAKIVSGLTPEEPFASAIRAVDGVYVIALVRQLPSEIPPFAEIRDRVAKDYQMMQAIGMAREAGTNFYVKLNAAMGLGKTFAAASTAEGLQPELLPPFSLSTRTLPALGDRAELNQVKQAAFTTEAGRTSSFVETGDGGFILYVQSRLPVDQAVMAAELPQFTESLRRARENEAFNQWMRVEATRALRDTPVARQSSGL